MNEHLRVGWSLLLIGGRALPSRPNFWFLYRPSGLDLRVSNPFSSVHLLHATSGWRRSSLCIRCCVVPIVDAVWRALVCSKPMPTPACRPACLRARPASCEVAFMLCSIAFTI